jgi:hypothetical protein
MIANFDHLGVVVVMPGPKDKAFPAVLEVEDQHKPIPDVMSEPDKKKSKQRDKSTLALRAASRERGVHGGAPGVYREVDISGIDKFRRFPRGLPVQFK